MLWSPSQGPQLSLRCFSRRCNGENDPSPGFFLNILLISRDNRPPASITDIIDTAIRRFIGGAVLQAPALQVGLQRLQDHVVDAHHRLRFRGVLVGCSP